MLKRDGSGYLAIAFACRSSCAFAASNEAATSTAGKNGNWGQELGSELGSQNWGQVLQYDIPASGPFRQPGTADVASQDLTLFPALAHRVTLRGIFNGRPESLP